MLSSSNEADIADLLCKLLEPVGNFRREHIKPSKGNSSRKRKRNLAKAAVAGNDFKTAPPPEIFSHITLGFNSTVRHLESLSEFSKPLSLVETSLEASRDVSAGSVDQLSPLSAVFVCLTGLPPILTSSLPLLAATASLASIEEPPILLVPLGKVAGEKLAQAVHQPRVGFVGLLSDTSTAENLMDLVRTHVQPVGVPWLKEADSGTYLPAKIRQTEVKVGLKKEKAGHSLHNNGGPT